MWGAEILKPWASTLMGLSNSASCSGGGKVNTATQDGKHNSISTGYRCATVGRARLTSLYSGGMNSSRGQASRAAATLSLQCAPYRASGRCKHIKAEQALVGEPESQAAGVWLRQQVTQ
jgi:hypothetical protein